QKVFSRRAALLSGLGAALLPSLVVWSIATLKETLVLFAALAALWIVQFLSEAHREDRRITDAVVLLLAVVVLLIDLRPATAFVFVGLVGLLVVARLHIRLRAWQMALAGLAVA